MESPETEDSPRAPSAETPATPIAPPLSEALESELAMLESMPPPPAESPEPGR